MLSYRRLDGWQNGLPASWLWLGIATESVHYSIRAVGLYNGLCDVYASSAVAHSNNIWRVLKILVHRIIKHCLRNIDRASPARYAVSEEEVDVQIQSSLDEICASVPFHLGSRTTISLPHEHQEYPPVPQWLRASAQYVDGFGQPTSMTDVDHVRTAAAVGGWFAMAPLAVIMRYAEPAGASTINHPKRLEPLKMRPGQYEWIVGQMKRVQKIYTIPQKPRHIPTPPPTPAPYPSL